MDSTIPDRQLHQTVAHFYENAPAFRMRMRAAGLTPADIETADDLSRLPVLRKDELIALQRDNPPFGGLLAVPISKLRRVFQSPGPINEPGPNLADSGRWAVALRAAGFQAGEIVLNAFGYHMTPAGSSLENSLETVGCVVIPGGIGNQEQQVQILASFKVTGYVGLPSYLNALVNKAEALDLSLNLRRAFVLAEPLPPSLRSALNERGIDVYQGYGTAECGNLGYECEELAGWHVPEGVYVQVCDINSGQPLPAGETGEVVATLLSRHYAIVRFGVGDLSSIIEAACPCGRPGPRLNGWQGRIGEATKVRGMFLHPRQLAQMMARFNEVTRYQAVITREEHRDDLALLVLLEPDADAESICERIVSTARQALRFRLSVRPVDAASLPPDSPAIDDQRVWDA